MYNQPPEAGLASLLASRGRNGDSVLVHMAPEEVAGLQQLALAHGGSLTVNPETGLYEANFLKKLLPMLAGAVLTPLTGGLINPMTAGLLVGGATALIEGDLKKGLMAGLGAYSGANISQALTKAAEAAVPPPPTPQDVAKVTQATEAAKNIVGAGPEAVNLAKPPISVPATPAGFDQMMAAARAGVSQASAPTGLAGIAQGAQGLLSSPQARSAFGTALGGPISKYATLAGAMDAMTPEVKPPTQAQLGEDMFYIPGQVNPNYGKGYNESYFLPGQYYKKTPQGLVPTNPYAKAPGYASGGMVNPFDQQQGQPQPQEQQSLPHQTNMLPPPNQNYPLSTVMRTNYGASPQPREVIGSYQEPIDPYTGEQRFADGGSVEEAKKKYMQMATAPAKAPVDTSAVMAYIEELNRRAKNPVATPYDTTPASAPTKPFNPFDPENNPTDPRNRDPVSPREETGTPSAVSPVFAPPITSPAPAAPPPAAPVTPPPVAAPPPVAPPVNLPPVDVTAPPTEPPADIPAVDVGAPITQPEINMPPTFLETAKENVIDPVKEHFMGNAGAYIGTAFGGPLGGVIGAAAQKALTTILADPAIISEEGRRSGVQPETQSGPATGGSRYDPPTGSKIRRHAQGGMTAPNPFGAQGEDYNFGFAGGGMPEYQAGGKLLDGPGDGMSDDIPAVIRGKGVQRAALADGEFVIPADVVSHLGNGSTKAGAKKLYQMMDRIRQARTGKSQQAPAVKANKYLPA